MSVAGYRGYGVTDYESKCDLGGPVLTGIDESLLERSGSTVGTDPDDAITGWCEVVVGGNLESALMPGTDVFVALGSDTFDHTKRLDGADSDLPVSNPSLYVIAIHCGNPSQADIDSRGNDAHSSRARNTYSGVY